MKKPRSHKYKEIDPVKQFRDWMKNTLRKAFFRYWERSKVIKNARVDRGLYKCASCLQVSKIDGHHVDHIQPVVETSVGFVDWDTYISRLFCPASNLQLLCSPCHKEKTKKEQEERKLAKTGIYASGKIHTEETKQKMSESHIGIIPNNIHHLHELKKQSVIATNCNTNEIRTFESLTKAAAELNISVGNITTICKGLTKRKTSKGWSFKYE